MGIIPQGFAAQVYTVTKMLSGVRAPENPNCRPAQAKAHTANAHCRARASCCRGPWRRHDGRHSTSNRRRGQGKSLALGSPTLEHVEKSHVAARDFVVPPQQFSVAFAVFQQRQARCRFGSWYIDRSCQMQADGRCARCACERVSVKSWFSCCGRSASTPKPLSADPETPKPLNS